VTRPDRGAAAWVALSAALALAALALWFAPRPALDWQPARALEQPWRAWSAAFVHWTPLHLGANLLGCVVVGAFGFSARVPLRGSVAWLVAWPLTQAALALQPRLVSYGGLSGVLHVGVVIAAWHLLREQRGRRRLIGAAVLAGVAVKLWLERPFAGPTQALPGWDFPVAPLAHVSGAAAGLLCALGADAVARIRR
jgi:rhomboid family GlyGly-CTERM serine protease